MNIYEKQKQAEQAFQDYLNKQKILFFYIDQEVSTKSTASRYLQRPDFILLLKNKTILIDVEHNIPLKKYPKFCISQPETFRYNNLKKHSNLEVYYAISNEKINYNSWYLINIQKVLSLNRYFVKDSHYYSIPIDSFTKVSSEDNIAKHL